jgi:hypothetical protein
MTAPLNENATTVAVDVMPDGTYAVGVHYGPDHSIALNPLQALTYVIKLYRVASSAEYGAAVLAQLSTLGIADDKALPTVGEILGKAWDGLDLAKTIHAIPVISATGRRPHVRFDLEGKPFAHIQVPAEDARKHAAAVQHAAANVLLDTEYHRYLRGPLNLPDDRARNLVADLAHHRIQ